MDADELTSSACFPEAQEDECLSTAQAHDLRDSAALFHSACNFTYDPIAMIDSGGKILFWNKAADRLFGYTAGEALGHNLYALIIPQRYRQVAAQFFDQAVATRKSNLPGKTVEIVCVRKDGAEILIEAAQHRNQLTLLITTLPVHMPLEPLFGLGQELSAAFDAG